MKRGDTWLLWAGVATVGATGIAYGWMRYLCTPGDPFAAINHPWQPAMQGLHILCAPILVAALGTIWGGHARPRLTLGARPERRLTGLAVLLVSGAMVLSGYALQVAADATWRRVWVVAHVACSVAWLAGTGAHALGFGSGVEAR
ncbi:MAG: hypothetical protein HYV63_25815 [Candidatus Schekmanbacteria bacterium]|nr:hypothetical protein [Candidatus Schekmanbacteria bacterium]